MKSGNLRTWASVKDFVFAGNATFTLQSTITGARFTYKMRRAEDKQIWFVSLLRGPDNENDFNYMGVYEDGRFRFTRKSTVAEKAPSSAALVWFFHRMEKSTNQDLPTGLEVWHEGRCGRCGRKLTVPESLERGLGPECADRAA